MRLIYVTFLLINVSLTSVFAQQKRQINAIQNSTLSVNSIVGCGLFNDPANYTTGTSFSFNAPTNNNSLLVGPSGANYGCMGSVPNQVYFIVTVTSPGNLSFNFSNSNSYDVDAVLWGPIINNDVVNACNSATNAPLSCDFDAGRPDLYISNAQVGQKYLMLVTNYSNASTVINISQPTGGAVSYAMANIPNCSLLASASISGTSTTINEGQGVNLTLNFSGGGPYTYSLSDGTIGTSTNNTQLITTYPTASQTYTINSISNVCGTNYGTGSVGISVVRNVNLKSCYPLDGNANDSQGLNNGGLINGPLASTNRNNEIDKAIQFDGIDDYINLPSNQLNNNTFSIGAWVKLDELPDINNPSKIIFSMGASSDEHFLGVEYNNGIPAWRFNSNSTNILGIDNVNTNWHYVVGVRSGGQVKLFVDGVLLSSANTSVATSFGSPLFARIGSGILNDKFFKGKIDELKIFNGSLIEPEILLLQNYTTCNNVYDDTYISVQSVSTSVICTNTSFTVRAFTNNIIPDNNLQYIAELSDINGNFSSPTVLGSSTFLPLNVTIPSNISNGFYKLRVRYGGNISVNSIQIYINNPATYNITGTTTLNENQSANISLNFGGTGPWSYVLSNGLSGVATTSPWLIPLNIDQSTSYFLSSTTNVCGVATLNGNNSATITVNYTKQLVTCLPFNAGSTDQINNNTTTLVGPLLTDNRYGQTSAAYSFNGTSDYLNYTTNLLRKREFTMSAWVIANTISSNNQFIISQGEIGTNSFQGLGVNNSGWFFQSSTSGGTSFATSTNNLLANQWIHLTAVRSYSNLKLYLNGELVSTAANNFNIPFKTSDIGRIGANSSTLGNYFNGKIDDVRLYKGALNDDEVFALYSFTGNCPTVENAPIIVVRGLLPISICAGNTTSVSFSSSNIIGPFNVQLSDSNGNFGSPIVIGTGSTSPIVVTIPVSSVNSNLYKIRLVSTTSNIVYSVNAQAINVATSLPSASISGGGNIINGQTINLNLSFTGASPWTYSINNGPNFTTSINPALISVSPFSSTNYSITSISNVCGNGTITGTATVTVSPTIILTSPNSLLCTGDNFNISFSSNFTSSGNYRAELSDSNGSFISPINIGQNASSPISVSIPNNISGSGFLIRIVSDNPNIISNISQILTVRQKPTGFISGSSTINEGQSTNLTLSFTGNSPYSYSISGGALQSTSSNSIIIPVSPITNTTYSISSVSNVCGVGISSGSAIINVIAIPVRLISCFPFNGNANDGQGLNNAITTSAILTNDRFGNINSAYNFNGVSNYIRTGVNSLSNPNYSVSVWVNFSNLINAGSYIFSFGASPREGIYYYDNKLYYSSTSGYDITNPLNIQFNTWYHLVTTRLGPNLKMYLNGVEIMSEIFSTNASYDLNMSSYIGMGYFQGAHFKGNLDDVQFYKGALTPSQVQFLYNAQNNTSTSSGCFDATTYVCISNSIYNSMLNGQQTLKVSNLITGSNIIQTGSNIHFDAKNAVLLMPGFKTEANTIFKASAGGGCSN